MFFLKILINEDCFVFVFSVPLHRELKCILEYEKNLSFFRIVSTFYLLFCR